jgi:hypothetical protein
MKTQERIGSDERLTTADRSTDFRVGLKPLKTRLAPAVCLRDVLTRAPRSTSGASRQRGTGPGLDRHFRVTIDKNVKRGKECRKVLRRPEGTNL